MGLILRGDYYRKGRKDVCVWELRVDRRGLHSKGLICWRLLHPCGLIAHWVQHCTGIVRSWAPIPFQSNFFQGFFNCFRLIESPRSSEDHNFHSSESWLLHSLESWSLPVNATRQTKMARNTSNHICSCVRPSGSAVGSSEVGRVEVMLLFISSKEKKNENVNKWAAYAFKHKNCLPYWPIHTILTNLHRPQTLPSKIYVLEG